MKKTLNIFWAIVFGIVILYNLLMIVQHLPIGNHRWTTGEQYAGERSYFGGEWVYDVKVDYMIDGKAYTGNLGVSEWEPHRRKVTIRYDIDNHYKITTGGRRQILINAVIGIGALGYLLATLKKIRMEAMKHTQM